MLKNKRDESITIRYNGILKSIQPDEVIDTRDFDIPNKEIKGVEKHIMLKYPGFFEIKETKTGYKDNDDSDKEIKDLKINLEKAESNILELKKTNDVLQEKHSAAAGEVESSRRQVESINKELTLLRTKNEELEDEIEKLRLQSRRVK